MTTTQMLVTEQQGHAAPARTNKVTPLPVTPLPVVHRRQPMAWLRRMLTVISQAGEPASTPQAPLVSPNGSVHWTPSAVDRAHRQGRH